MLTLKQHVKQLNKLSENYLNFTQLDSSNNVLIKNIIDKSDRMMDRIHIIFKNNHKLSIVRGKYSYGGNKGLFEIMVLTPMPSTGKHDYNDPLGHCDIQDLNKHIKYIGTLPQCTETEELPNDSSHK